MENLTIEQRAARVKLLLLDCDGVLTDGRFTLREGGDEYKAFHTRDGQGLALLHRAGLQSGIISGRSSSSVTRRALELGIRFIRQGESDKLKVFQEILAASGVPPEATAYVGDDLPDIPLLRRVGLAVAVADATPETRAAAHYVTQLAGGRGAVREVTDLILQTQGRWSELLKPYLAD
jgi:3-deoxy-D-manno-octulosonate 8-phosphate phosphatase (KDO 8-P phosphatase)